MGACRGKADAAADAISPSTKQRMVSIFISMAALKRARDEAKVNFP
jgi:hypothetical protein